MTKKSLPTVKVVYINPNDSNKDILYLEQNSKSIFGYSGGIHKYLNERIVPNPLIKSDPMELKKFNFYTMYKDHLLSRSKGRIDEWRAFLKQDAVTVGVLYEDFVDSFQSAIEDVMETLIRDPQFQPEKQETPEYELEEEVAYN